LRALIKGKEGKEPSKSPSRERKRNECVMAMPAREVSCRSL